MCKFFLFVLLLCISAPSFAALSPSEIQDQIARLSPMPARPTIRGIRFGYYHLLENLRNGITEWLNPAHTKNYLYRSTPGVGLDTSAEFSAHVELYERLLNDYQELSSSGEIDRYSPLGVRHAYEGMELLPDRYDLPAAVADRFASHAFGLHYHLGRILTIINKQLWDHRYITSFLFTTYVDRRHRPLESISSLAESSSKAPLLLKRIMDRFKEMVEQVNAEFVAISRQSMSSNSGNGLRWRLQAADLKGQEVDHRLTYLTDGLYKAVQFANDIVRDKRIGVAELELVAANLGDQLHASIEDIGTFRQELAKIAHIDWAVPRRNISVDDRMIDTYRELTRILGLQGHVGGVTVFSDLRSSSPELPYQMFYDTAVLQHVLAMGSIMAKISETPEGRGNWRQRLGQEIAFRRAQIHGPAKTSSGKDLVVLTDRDPKAPAVQRRNFAAPELTNRRQEIEDKLWRIFFEHAGLNLSGPVVCGQLLLPSPPRFLEQPRGIQGRF